MEVFEFVLNSADYSNGVLLVAADSIHHAITSAHADNPCWDYFQTRKDLVYNGSEASGHIVMNYYFPN